MTKRRKSRIQVPTTEQVERGIYIDFEGYTDKSPMLLGVFMVDDKGEDDYDPVILERSLDLAADAKALRKSDLTSELERLAELCELEDRLLFAFSSHELEVARDYASDDLARRIEAVYRDGKEVAKKWVKPTLKEDPEAAQLFERRKLKGRLLGRWRLKYFLEYIDFELSPDYGDGCTTKRLRDVEAMLAKRGSYQKLTPVAKAKWTKLLKHNRQDCRGLREVVMKAVEGLQ